MLRPMLKRILISLFGVWCVVYFSGVDWIIGTPSANEEFTQPQNIGGTGTGPPSTNFLFKFIKSAQTVQTVAGTSSSPPPPADAGNWNGTLVPPAGAPYNNLWPLSPSTSVAIYEGANFKVSQPVQIVEVP